jgi:AcrR family transcriptional regulator
VSISNDSYHHGDLKNALIAAGVKLLASEGLEGLSLRKLARDIGVSHNAPYMHFADKEALLAAIGEQGFRLLGDAIAVGQADVREAPIETRVTRAAHSYVTFALAHPSHLGVMFGSLSSSNYPDLAQAAGATFEMLIEIVRDGKRGDELADFEAEHVALLIWTTAHGLSSLLIAQKIPSRALAPLHEEQWIEHLVDMMCQGILKRNEPL